MPALSSNVSRYCCIDAPWVRVRTGCFDVRSSRVSQVSPSQLHTYAYVRPIMPSKLGNLEKGYLALKACKSKNSVVRRSKSPSYLKDHVSKPSNPPMCLERKCQAEEACILISPCQSTKPDKINKLPAEDILWKFLFYSLAFILLLYTISSLNAHYFSHTYILRWYSEKERGGFWTIINQGHQKAPFFALFS